MAAGDEGRAFVDLHCHTRASFDSLADPRVVVRAAAGRGLTHLAITDHDRIDAALEGRSAAPAGLQVIVGEEIRSTDGDMVALFLERAIAPGLSALETIAAVREQGGLVGIPHPFDRFRRFARREHELERIAGQIDWVEAYNARVLGGRANEEAAHFARERHLAGVAVSDAHTVMEVGVAYTILRGDPSTPEGMLAALAGTIELTPGRATYLVRGMSPVAKILQRLRGNGRVRPGAVA